MLICCLQKEIEDLLDIVSHIETDSNPTYLYMKRLKYEKQKKEGKYNALKGTK